MNSRPENELVRRQLSVIKRATNSMLENAEYGNYAGFLRDIRKINDAASKISKGTGTVIPSQKQKKYNKILVPYDGSKYSKKALVEAIDIASEFGSDLHVINVIEISSDTPASVMKEIINKKLKKLTRDILEPNSARVSKIIRDKMKKCEKEGIMVFCDAIIGKPANSILKFAKENNVDLIIIGSKGLTRIKKLMALGSVSRKVSEESKCPVMIIR